MAKYRTEWKFICSSGQLELIRTRLSGILSTDPHAGPEGSYRVRSLYFDDHRNSCAAGNESGDGIRYKYRIRYYDSNIPSLHLERKAKQYGLGAKTSCPLSVEAYRSLSEGNAGSVFWQTDVPLLREFCTLIMTRCFAPKAIIDYERSAFVEPVTHIRITLDSCISAAYEYGSFLSGDYQCFPVMYSQRNILEVKFDEILPGWLRQMLESLNLQQTTFSKYYNGRKRLEEIIL